MAERSSTNQLLRCDFCGGGQREVKRIVAGPGRYICQSCVHKAREGTALEAVPPDAAAACSFCGKARATVVGMVVHGDVRICGECLDLCDDIIGKEAGERGVGRRPRRQWRRR